MYCACIMISFQFLPLQKPFTSLFYSYNQKTLWIIVALLWKEESYKLCKTGYATGFKIVQKAKLKQKLESVLHRLKDFLPTKCNTLWSFGNCFWTICQKILVIRRREDGSILHENLSGGVYEDGAFVAADAWSPGAYRFSLSVKVSGLQRWRVKNSIKAKITGYWDGKWVREHIYVTTGHSVVLMVVSVKYQKYVIIFKTMPFAINMCADNIICFI